MTALPTLIELIDTHLPAQGLDRDALAQQLSVSPSTLSRWSARMPGPDTVRALATALNQPYAVVLAAALRSGGYAETTSDVLAGLPITLVARDPAGVDTDQGDIPGAVFTDSNAASRWARVREQLDLHTADYGHGSVATGTAVIDGATTPNHVVLYRADWRHRTDTVEVTEAGIYATAPESIDPEAVQIDSLRETGRAFRVSAYGTDADAVRQLVSDHVTALRKQDLLLGVQAATGLDMTDHIMHEQRLEWAAWAQERRTHAEQTEQAPPLSPEDRALMEKFLEKAKDVPYVWGGGRDSTQTGRGDAPQKPWRDPISTTTVRAGEHRG